MLITSVLALAALSAAPVTPMTAQGGEAAPGLAPSSPWTHMLRVGPTSFAAVGPAGSCEECLFPNASVYPAGGIRVDYVLQRGHSNLRWHTLVSLELGWGSRAISDAMPCTTDPTGRCDRRDVSGSPVAALFAGTGLRLDTSPKSDSACILELDGTIGASTTPHVGLFGLHWAIGARFDTRWEILLSVESDVLAFGQVGGALVLGRSL